MFYTGAGVLPYAFFNNTIYFLIGREHKEVGWTGSNTFSDFGGAVEAAHESAEVLAEYGANPNEYATITAAVEFWEETMGLFYNSQQTFKMLTDQKGIKLASGTYLEHLLRVEYNPFWVELFTNAYNYVLSCAVASKKKIGMMHIPSCPDGFTEKTEIKWISYADLKNAVDMSNPEYRYHFRKTLQSLFKHNDFHQLLAEASIFKDPSIVGFIAPINPEPILPRVEYQWPVFYPNKNELITGHKLIASGPINSVKTQYHHLIVNLPIVIYNEKMAQMFQYIDSINQYHQEVKLYVYLKSLPGAKATDLPIMKNIYWVSKYCPLIDVNLQSKKLGSGSYGDTFLLSGPITKCCSKPLQFVAKSIKHSFDSTQLMNLALDSPCNNVLPKKKITDIFATESVSLAAVNCLVTHSVCYNFPYFYGTSLCQTNNITYMYMQFIEKSFSEETVTDTETDSIILQGLMGLYAMYKLKLVHGDINEHNLSYNLLPPGVTKNPIYQIKSELYLMGPKTNKILYFIDFGMGFIKDVLEPAPRLIKDKQRINNNVNWQKNIEKNIQSDDFKGPGFNAYKGYYVHNSDQADAAYLRRHLLDLYLLSETFNKKFGATKIISEIQKIILPIFYNPYFYALHPERLGYTSAEEIIDKVWELILKNNQIYGKIESYDRFEIRNLNPSDLMFLGNLHT